ncbi:hypothetical protein NDU88_006949 [Pleurodeles waltl]|uniref:Uncharacterized protein n=1 Tax=Pleurodeles waltl TaxID=8319 RepID=A0AAV7N2C6_PLEWA|nr:hypothetical protein NDU88_006949 [Pleurodeles waltl]
MAAVDGFWETRAAPVDYRQEKQKNAKGPYLCNLVAGSSVFRLRFFSVGGLLLLVFCHGCSLVYLVTLLLFSLFQTPLVSPSTPLPLVPCTFPFSLPMARKSLSVSLETGKRIIGAESIPMSPWECGTDVSGLPDTESEDAGMDVVGAARSHLLTYLTNDRTD